MYPLVPAKVWHLVDKYLNMHIYQEIYFRKRSHFLKYHVLLYNKWGEKILKRKITKKRISEEFLINNPRSLVSANYYWIREISGLPSVKF